jgi:crotonobetainyl-CoA:carnitine CoA-transferase CaiB-like acyl-CoA transferase
VTERLAAIFQTRPAAEWTTKLGPLGAAVNAVNQGPDIAADPQHAARRSVVKVAGEDVPASPVRLIDAEGRRSATATAEPPLVGEHTDAVLGSAGFSADEIAALRQDAVI